MSFNILKVDSLILKGSYGALSLERDLSESLEEELTCFLDLITGILPEFKVLSLT
jgi:hypothetical protein